MGGKSVIKCEIFGVRKRGKTENIFLARFPLNPERCKLWVKATGHEDLAYIPVRRLNASKYICGEHFSIRAFNKKGSRLKRNATPVANLLNPPLPDEILKGFPYRPAFVQRLESIESSEERQPEDVDAKEWHIDHSYSKPGYRCTRTDVICKDEAEDECLSVSDDLDDEDCQVVDEDLQAVVDDDDLSFYLNLQKKRKNKDSAEQQEAPEKADQIHEGFMCNHCSGVIKGYRYLCVECTDYDLCSSCEASGEHCLHYMLRIPRPKPYAEIQSVLDKIRQLLCRVDTIGPSATQRHSDDIIIKKEVKEEDDPLSVEASPAPEPASQEDVHFHADTNKCTKPEVKTRTIKMANTLLTIKSRLKPSASTKRHSTSTKRKRDDVPTTHVKKHNLATIKSSLHKPITPHKTLISIIKVKRKEDLKKSLKFFNDSQRSIEAKDSTTKYNPRTKRKGHDGPKRPAKVSPKVAKKLKVALTPLPIELLRKVGTLPTVATARSRHKSGVPPPAPARAPARAWRYDDDSAPTSDLT